jgi:hypothetical protein
MAGLGSESRDEAAASAPSGTLPTRRDAIILIGGGLAATVAAAASSTPVRADQQVNDYSTAKAAVGFVGTVVSTSDAAVVLQSSGARVTVQPMSGARMYSGASGRVFSAANFIPGDRIFVEGATRNGDVVVARAMGSVYEPVEFTVSSVDSQAGVAKTSIGQLDLNGAIPDERVVRSISAGQTLRGTGWTDPRSGQQYLMLAESDELA